MARRTRGWWLIRLELGAAIVLVGIVAVLWLRAMLGIVVRLGWMVRTVRGPRDERPTW